MLSGPFKNYTRDVDVSRLRSDFPTFVSATRACRLLPWTQSIQLRSLIRIILQLVCRVISDHSPFWPFLFCGYDCTFIARLQRSDSVAAELTTNRQDNEKKSARPAASRHCR